MNRLWVRISLVIGLVVILVAIFPNLWRMFNRPPDMSFPPPPSDGFSTEQTRLMQRFIQDREERIWLGISWTLLAGAAIGLLAGIMLSRGLVSPLRALEEAAHAISSGKLSHRVPIAGSQELRSLAQAFNQMAQELEHAEILRQNLLADVAHELRHPIHIVQGNLQAILDGVYPLEMSEIANLVDETHHLTALVNDLYELAQAEAHQLPLDKQQLDLVDLITKSVEAFQPIATGQEIQLLTNLPKTPLIIHVDADRLRQVLQNLLHNALQHTPANGQISVSLQKTSTGVEICVQDSGSGIAPEHLPHIFDRFYRADQARARHSGSAGLGLPIARAIIEAHGGTINAFSSDKDHGSTFSIHLP